MCRRRSSGEQGRGAGATGLTCRRDRQPRQAYTCLVYRMATCVSFSFFHAGFNLHTASKRGTHNRQSRSSQHTGTRLPLVYGVSHGTTHITELPLSSPPVLSPCPAHSLSVPGREAVQPLLKTDGSRTAAFRDQPMLTSAGPVTAATLANANIA